MLVQTVHLSATLPYNSRFVRPVIFSSYSRRLNVCSRGLKREQALLEILRELAVHGLKIKPSYGHKLSHQQLKEVDEVVSPLLQQIVPAAAGDGDTGGAG